MNSPPEPGSPSLSTESSGSPPPDDNFSLETPNQEPGGQGYLARLASLAGRSTDASSGGSKRRLPTGLFGIGGSSRDAKTRKRGDSAGSRGVNWDGGMTREPSGGTRKDKDDLIDPGLVDLLRKEIGDPFLE